MENDSQTEKNYFDGLRQHFGHESWFTLAENGTSTKSSAQRELDKKLYSIFDNDYRKASEPLDLLQKGARNIAFF